MAVATISRSKSGKSDRGGGGPISLEKPIVLPRRDGEEMIFEALRLSGLFKERFAQDAPMLLFRRNASLRGARPQVFHDGFLQLTDNELGHGETMYSVIARIKGHSCRCVVT
jgi:hypothetical protein